MIRGGSTRSQGTSIIIVLNKKQERTQRGSETMQNDYSGIRKQQMKYKAVQGLMKYINVESIKKKHKEQPKGKASGIDNMTKSKYDKNLEKNVSKLIDDMKQFSYRPKPVRRTYIPKANGKLRPLGIPCYEDKLVQGVMADILNAIYEPIFLDCSFGFRQSKSCHQAIKQLDEHIMRGRTNYIVDADIKGFFDHVNHEWLIKFLEHDIKDKHFIRYIKRFLNSGVMEQGKYLDSEEGTPQGGLISPVLANVYLHYVLDLWFELYVKIKCTGKGDLVRYADDFVACFENESDANWFYQELIERLAKFGLEIELSKTKIFPFGRNTTEKHEFDFLGFTVFNSKTGSNAYKCSYRTSKKKSKIKYQDMKKYIKQNMHADPKDLIDGINLRLNGLFNYYGISFNKTWMDRFYRFTKTQIKYWLNRRSQRGKMNWEEYGKLLEDNPLVQPRITFSLW